MRLIAPVGNGRVLAYFFGNEKDIHGYLRGTNVLRVKETSYAAVGEEIVAGDFDAPPLGGATRAAIVERVPGLTSRDAVEAVYARSVLVIAQHQMPSGEFLGTGSDEDVLLAYALDVCGERGAAEAFYAWALAHRTLDGRVIWGLEQHLRVAYGSALRQAYQRLKDRPGPELRAQGPRLPTASLSALEAAVRKRTSLDLFMNEDGVDLKEHALFLITVHALIPRRGGGEDFFFEHQGQAQQTHRARALYAGAFHAGLTAAGDDPRLAVEVREGIEVKSITQEAAGAGRYKLKVETRDGSNWASDSDPRPGGQEFAFGTTALPPEWVQDAVMYQIMVDRFARTDGALPPPGSPTALYGGTLDGVREHLDHIANLGCNVLWLTPVHQTPSHHGYDYEDFFMIEPRYGGNAALRRLIESAHGLGMRVLLDFVPNHTGRGHRLFREALARGGEAAEFYRFWQWPHYYRCFGDGVLMPELDTGNRRVQRYLVEVAQHWISDYGADGLRCDHVAGADPSFWVELRKGVRQVKPDALVLGEATGRFEWLARYAGRLDAIFDFDFAHMVRDTFARGRTNLPKFASWMDAHEGTFPGLALATLLDNHDMTRFLWMARGDKRRLKLAATLLMTLPGMPVIYYGTEVGLTQRDDGSAEHAEARLPMLWGSDQDRDLLLHFQRLGRLRSESAALRRGSRRTLSADANSLVYERAMGDERVVVSLNLADLSGSVVDGSGRDRLGEDDVLGVRPDQRAR